MSTIIPNLTKEDVFSINEINAVKAGRRCTEEQLTELITDLNELAEGSIKSFILNDMWKNMTDAQWKNLKKNYIKWQILIQVHTEVYDNSSAMFREDFYTTVRAINENFRLQAEEKVVTTTRKNIKIKNY